MKLTAEQVKAWLRWWYREPANDVNLQPLIPKTDLCADWLEMADKIALLESEASSARQDANSEAACHKAAEERIGELEAENAALREDLQIEKRRRHEAYVECGKLQAENDALKEVNRFTYDSLQSECHSLDDAAARAERLEAENAALRKVAEAAWAYFECATDGALVTLCNLVVALDAEREKQDADV